MAKRVKLAKITDATLRVAMEQADLERAHFANVIRIAEDHLAQYVAYSEAMRKEGRGMYLSSAYDNESLAAMLAGCHQLLAKEIR